MKDYVCHDCGLAAATAHCHAVIDAKTAKQCLRPLCDRCINPFGGGTLCQACETRRLATLEEIAAAKPKADPQQGSLF